MMDHFSDLMSNMFPDSTIAKTFSSKHTKARSTVKHVIADDFYKTLEKTLKTTRFSVIIDKTTDISSQKLLAIVVPYFSEIESTIKSHFLKQVPQSDGSDAISFISSLVSYFENATSQYDRLHIRYNKCHAMFGEQLKKKKPLLYTMKCLCHSAHLCASHACEKLSRVI